MRTLLLPVCLIFILPDASGAGETNGFLVFEIDRVPFHAAGSEIKQKFKVPLTAEFLSNFRHLPSQNSMGTGFCCGGGKLKSNQSSTGFSWWIRKTTDHRWQVILWGEGVETVDGFPVNSRNPKTSQNLTIKNLEDLDMSYLISCLHNFDGINVSFSAKYESADDLKAEGDIPAAPVRKADRAELFKGDDSSQLPVAVSCIFQEG